MLSISPPVFALADFSRRRASAAADRSRPQWIAARVSCSPGRNQSGRRIAKAATPQERIEARPCCTKKHDERSTSHFSRR